MKATAYIAAVLVGLALAPALHAQPVAEPFYPGYSELPPYDVVALVRSTGLDPVSRPVRQGPVYVLRALNPAGQELRVVVDARMGRIVRVAAIAPDDPGAFGPPARIPPGRALPGGNAPTSRAMPRASDDDTEFEPAYSGAPAVPPRPPARTAAKPPPLPRARPKEAAAAAAAVPTAPEMSTPPAITRPSASAENTAQPATAAEIDE